MKIKRNIVVSQLLDEYLNSLYFSKKDIHLLKMEKRVLINDKIVASNIQLQENDQIEIDITKPEEINVKAVDYKLDIVYEDDVCLVINKPINLIIHDDSNKQVTLDNYVAGYYQKTNQKHKVFHVHRLDNQTSGLILYCKEAYLMAYFDHILSTKQLQRTYLARVNGLIDKKMTINKPIGRDRHISNKYRVSETGLNAITYIQPISQNSNSTLLKCQLYTGRTHQIRVHLSSIGHPIVGDIMYGGSKNTRVLLHSYSINFIHPVTNEEVNIICPIEF